MLKKIQLSERYLFLLCLVLNLIPVLITPYFPSLDGVAHLYNSNLIQHLVIEDNELLKRFYSFNEFIVPNWTGHFLFSFFISFLPSFIAEKIVLILYLILMPVSFRLLVRQFSNNQNILYSYLIFPFTYSIVFHYGFMNFSFGIILLIFSIYCYLLWYNKLLKLKFFLIISILIFATYLSHLFVFIFLLITLFIIITVRDFYEKRNRFIFNSNYLMKLLQIGLISFFPLILSYIYFISREGERIYSYLSFYELVSWLINARPAIYFYENEFTKIIFWCLVACTTLFLISYFSKKRYIGINKRIYLTSSFILLIILVLLYFLAPNSDGFAGFFSIRFCLLIFIFWILFVSIIEVNKYLLSILVLLTLFVHIKVLIKFSELSLNFDNKISELVQSSGHIEDYSVVLPIDLTNDWTQVHFSNYIGLDKPLIILENYEVFSQYFPLKWDYKNMPQLLLSDKTNEDFECIDWVSGEADDYKNIEYVFIYGSEKRIKSKCYNDFYETINSGFTLIYQTEYIKIYKWDN